MFANHKAKIGTQAVKKMTAWQKFNLDESTSTSEKSEYDNSYYVSALSDENHSIALFKSVSPVDFPCLKGTSFYGDSIESADANAQHKESDLEGNSSSP